MYSIADTDRLVTDGVISEQQAREIEGRARESMVMLGINTLLCLGIIAATGGLIFWLADAAVVAVSGTLSIVAGLLILTHGSELFRMFGNAATLIGAGMLIGGASFELIDKYEDIAGTIMFSFGAVIALFSAWLLKRRRDFHFLIGSVLLMGLAMHIVGFGLVLEQNDISGLPKSLFFLYTAVLLAGAGWLIDVRFVSALAIAPFAQALDTGTGYFHAVYVFYSPEPTLSILQMAVLIVLCLWLAGRVGERTARHLRVLAAMAFIVANLCALVGSLWGDVVGASIWGPGSYGSGDYGTYEDFRTALGAFRETALVLSPDMYSIVWAVVLAVLILWAAHSNNRGMFNASLTFGGIHAYTQLFESFSDKPLAYVIGGLAAIPLAWAMWRLNHWIGQRKEKTILA